MILSLLIAFVAIAFSHTIFAEQQVTHKAFFLINEAKTADEKKKRDNFINDCATFAAQENSKIPGKAKNIFRIVTWNVHEWKEPLFSTNFFSPAIKDMEKFFSIVDELDPDILVLEEASIPAFPNDSKEFYNAWQNKGFNYNTFANTLCWDVWNNPLCYFGNWILSKHLFKSSLSKAYYDESDFEWRHYVKVEIELPNKKNISVYGTHLDVWDFSETKRSRELAELITATQSDQNENVIITGDFNSNRQKDYTEERGCSWDVLTSSLLGFLKTKNVYAVPTLVEEQLDTAGFVDCFTKKGWHQQSFPLFTTWNGTTVDYIMLNARWNLPIKWCGVHYNALSDHIPVIMDIIIEPEEVESEVATKLSILQENLQSLQNNLTALSEQLNILKKKISGEE